MSKQTHWSVVSALVTFRNDCLPLPREKTLSVFSDEQINAPRSSNAHVVIVADPPGWPSARPHTWYEADAFDWSQVKSVGTAVLQGSWKTAPFPRPISLPEQS